MDDAWSLAKARFLDGLEDRSKSLFNGASAENLLYDASNANREDRDRSKVRSALLILQPLLAAIEDYGKALDTISNVASLYLCPIWGSIRVLLVMASGHARFYGRMVDTFARIGDILPRFRK